MREEKGPGRKINGLFHWISEDSLILHEVARAAGLEGHGSARRVNSLCMKNMESTCAYCVPLMDWKGEVKYLVARGADYIAQIPGNEDPRKWYDRSPAWRRPGMRRPRRGPPPDDDSKGHLEVDASMTSFPAHREARQCQDQRQEAPGQNSVWEKAAAAPMHGGQESCSSGGRRRGWIH
jgi:hypothetical protein